MRRRLAVTTIAAVTALATPTARASSACSAAFTDCTNAFSKAPTTRQASLCFLFGARKSSQWNCAIDLLSNLRERHPDVHWIPLTLAFIANERGADNVEELLEEALVGFVKDQELQGELDARASLRYLAAVAGRVDEADAHAERIRQISEQAADPELRVKAIIQYADHLFGTRQGLRRAYRTLRAVEAQLPPDATYWSRYNLMSALSRVTQALGRHVDAMRYLGSLEKIAVAQDDAAGTRYARVNLADARNDVLEYWPVSAEIETALQQARATLDATITSKQPRYEARLRWHVAVLQMRDPTAEAIVREHLERCLLLAKETKQTHTWVQCARTLALAVADEDPKRAQVLMESAVSEGITGRMRTQQIWTSRAQMKLEWKLGPSEEALRASMQGLDLIETLRKLQPPGLGRIETVSLWARDYRLVAGHILRNAGESPKAEDLERAFSVLERMRARSLLERVALTEDAPARSRHPKAWAALQEALQEIADIQQKLLASAPSQAEREALRASLAEAERVAEARREAFLAAAEAPAGYREPTYATLNDIQGALGADEAMLVYQLGLATDLEGDFGGGAWVWVVTHDGARVFPIADRIAQRPRIRRLLARLTERRRVDADALRPVYDDLLAVAMQALGPAVQRLVVVPDGMLHQVPFSVLRPDAQTRPLGLTHEISIAPSATVWLGLRRRSPPDTPKLAYAIADPKLDPSALPAAVRELEDFRSLRLSQLPYARREGKQVVDTVGGASVLRLGAEATEASFKRDVKAGRYAVVHAATHALADAVIPERASLVLAPGSDTEDGLLQAREIVDLDLNGSVVILYACESAAGQVAGGEGAMSLARAFAIAGARAVVGSLWPLRDDDALFLSRALYDDLAAGERLGAAIRRAQREAFASGRPDAAWAGLTVLGDASVTPFPDASPAHRRRRSLRAVLAVGLLVLLALVSVVVFRGRLLSRR